MILEKNNTQKINTTQMGKNYLFITNSPQLRNAGLCEYLYETKLGAKIEYRPKAPTKSEKLTFKDGKFPTKRDYSAYCIKMNVKEEDAFVLQLCPFIKLERKKYLDCSKVEAECSYINSFFRLPKEIEEITEKEKENVEKYIKTFQDYLDNINNSLSPFFVKKEYEYPILSLFLTVSALYVFQKELKDYKYFIDTDRTVYFYQTFGFNYNNKLRVIFSQSYIMLDEKNIYF